jgi:PTH1 family peptidyl-tRNA hydrolase
MLRLTAFLGNPGAEYARNRHNAGRLLLSVLPFYGNLSWTKKFKGLYAVHQVSAETEKTHFLMPETYMNLSGESVLAAATFFKIKPEEIIVIHDELELPLGTVAFKFAGGLGGHNGLRSMKQHLGTAEFWRLRIGIGRPIGSTDIAAWVLSNFSAEEQALLEPVLEAAAAALLGALGPCGPEEKRL